MSETVVKLTAWVAEQLAKRQWQFDSEVSLGPAIAGAGFRRYYRVPGTKPALLAVDAPPATEDNQMFVHLASQLRELGLHTPEVVAADIERGFMLVEDLGEQLFWDVLTHPDTATESADTLYGEALMEILRLQQLKQPPEVLPSYDSAMLQMEMNLMGDWLCGELLSTPLGPADQSLLKETFALLEANALEQPQVLVHRDFHSQNLLVREGCAPGVIDFQGAVWGPVTYDLVSLLRDCYLRWSPERVKRWALAYANLAFDAGVMEPVSEQQFLRWFDLTGLQRHIKVLGIFARLWVRDQRDVHLKDLPLVMRYVVEVADSYPETQAFAQWFRERIIPACEGQLWYVNYSRAGVSPG